MSRRTIIPVLVGAALILSGCGGQGSSGPPLGTLTYTTPNALPPAWTPTTIAPSAIPGWDLYLGVDVEIWLPAAFVGGDPAARREELLEIARTAGAGYEGIVQALEQQPENLLFYSWDLLESQTIVGITRHEAPAEMTVEGYLEGWVNAILGEFPTFTAISHGPVTVGSQTVGRAVMDVPQQGVVTRQISYLFKSEGTVWVVSFAFPAERYTELAPMVELSVQTFRPLVP
jgi:hypothetical protein